MKMIANRNMRMGRWWRLLCFILLFGQFIDQIKCDESTDENQVNDCLINYNNFITILTFLICCLCVFV